VVLGNLRFVKVRSDSPKKTPLTLDLGLEEDTFYELGGLHVNCMRSSVCQHGTAMVCQGMSSTTCVVIPEEHSCVGIGEGPLRGHGYPFQDKTSMSRHSCALLRHFCMGIVEGQESPTAAISGGMRSRC